MWEGTERIGEITVSMPPGRQVSGTDRTLLADIATQAGLGMRTAQLAAQLHAQVEQASAQTSELEASRLRLLAAQESQRQRLTRAVSAEVLPHLAQLRVGLAQAAAATDPAAASRFLDAAMETTNRALEALRDIARGVFPPLLARKGLAAALRVYAARAGGRVALTVAPPARTARFPSHLEAVTYFCAVETVRELGGSALVDLDLDDSHLTLTVTAVDLSGRLVEGGQGVIDRVLAWDGTVTIDAHGAPARLRVSFPQLPVTGPDRRQPVGSESGLGDVGYGPALLRLPIPVVLVVCRQKHDGGGRRILAQPAGSLHPVHTGEVHVHQDQIRTQHSGRHDRFLGRRCAANQDEAVRLIDNSAHHAPEQRLVVDDENTDRIHRLTSSQPSSWTRALQSRVLATQRYAGRPRCPPAGLQCGR